MRVRQQREPSHSVVAALARLRCDKVGSRFHVYSSRFCRCNVAGGASANRLAVVERCFHHGPIRSRRGLDILAGVAGIASVCCIEMRPKGHLACGNRCIVAGKARADHLCVINGNRHPADSIVACVTGG